MRRWLKRIALGFIALLIVAAGVGAVFEFNARRQAAVNFPPVGKMVSIGERSLQIDCRGSGSPTVVFESGLDTYGSLSWATVHDQIAEFSRACAYSRAGMLWSEPADDPRAGEAVTDDLNKLLNAAGEKPLFVLVGHSLGGPYAMIYTERYGADVAGLVFVDASHPDQAQRFQEVTGAEPGLLMPTIFGALRRLTWSGLIRLLPIIPIDGSDLGKIVAAYGPTSFAAVLQEQDAADQTISQAAVFRDLGARPLSALTGMRGRTVEDLKAMELNPEQFEQRRALSRVWLELQADQARWSTVSEHQIVPDAGHYIHIEKPEVVINAVKWVLVRVRDAI